MESRRYRPSGDIVPLLRIHARYHRVASHADGAHLEERQLQDDAQLYFQLHDEWQTLCLD